MGMMQKPYADIVTHQRATASSRWNEFGQFEVVPANQPCIDHDPASLGASTSAVEIGLGDKTFATTAVYAVGDVVQASVSSGVFVRGRVKSSVAGSLTLEVVAVGGSGTHSAWVLIRVRGLGVWEQRTNLLSHSDRIEDAVWHANSAGYRLEKHAAISPSGKADAFKLVEDSSNGPHGIARSSLDLAGGTTYISVICAKAGERSLLILGSNTKDNQSTHALFDLATGQSSALFNAGGLLINHWIVSLGGGWYLCAAAINAGTQGNGYRFSFSMSVPSAGNTGNPILPKSYQGDGKSGLYVWGPGLQQGSFRTPHIPTPASFVSRAGSATFFDTNGVLQTAAANVARDQHHVFIGGKWVRAGLLLEPQATNLLQNSGPVNAAAGVVSGGTVTGSMPTGWGIANGLSGVLCEVVGSGTENGLRFVDFKFSGQQAAGGFFNIGPGACSGLVSGKSYTYSVFIKKVAGASAPRLLLGAAGVWSNAIDASLSSERTRVTATSVATADGVAWPRIGFNFGTTTTTDLTVRIYEVQFEEGSVATSTIITNGSQVTRAADVSTSAQVTRAGDPPHVPISAQWFRAAEGCLYVEFEANPAGTPASRVAAAFKSAAPNALEVRAVRRAGDLYPVGACSTGETLAVLTAGTASTGRERCAIAWKGGKVIFARNGSVSAEVPADPAVAQRLAIGLSDSLTASHINGWISTLRSYMRRPTDAELQTLTTIGYIPGKDT